MSHWSGPADAMVPLQKQVAGYDSLAAATLSSISEKRRVLLVISAAVFLVSLCAAWQELSSLPKSVLSPLLDKELSMGVDSIYEWTFVSSLRVTGLVLLPGLVMLLFMRLVAIPWISKRTDSGKQIAPAILISVAGVLLLVRIAMVSIQVQSRQGANLPEFQFENFELLMMGTFVGCLAIAAFLPKRFPIALLFSTIVTLAGIGVEVSLTSNRSAALGPTFDALGFGGFFLPVAFLLRQDQQLSRRRNERGWKLALGAVPAFLAGTFFWFASSHVDFLVLAVTRDYSPGRLASEASRCRVRFSQD